MTTRKARCDAILQERGFGRQRGQRLGRVEDLREKGYTPGMCVASALWGKTFEEDLMTWKLAPMGLALGYHKSTICRWRQRLIESNRRGE